MFLGSYEDKGLTYKIRGEEDISCRRRETIVVCIEFLFSIHTVNIILIVT